MLKGRYSLKQKIKFLVNDELAYCIQNHNEFYDDFKKENYLDFLIALEQNEDIFSERILQKINKKESVNITVGEGMNKEVLTFNVFIQEANNVLMQIELSLHYREQYLGYCDCTNNCEGLSCDWSMPVIKTKVITESNKFEYRGNFKQLKEERERLMKGLNLIEQ